MLLTKDGFPVLADFGLMLKGNNCSSNRNIASFGTNGYMAPELVNKKTTY